MKDVKVLICSPVYSFLLYFFCLSFPFLCDRLQTIYVQNIDLRTTELDSR